MNPIRPTRRLAGILTGLACASLGLAAAAPAAFARVPVIGPPDESTRITPAPPAPVVTHTIVVDGDARLADHPDRPRGRAPDGHDGRASGPGTHRPP
jgi:hypothetical protein